MQLSDVEALSWVTRLVSLSIIIQTIELFCLKRAMSDQGVWSWPIIRRDFEVFPRPLQWLFDRLLSYPNFLGVLAARLVCALVVLCCPHPAALVVLLATTTLIALRWRGTFNGGSDFMTLIVLTGLCLATVFGDSRTVRLAALWYITVQTCTSYFVAGIIKLKRRNWRTGHALAGFLRSGIHGATTLPVPAALVSWAVLAFECTFPLALKDPRLCLGFLGVGLCFHLGNAWTLGLNRFFYAWAAAYPAVFFCSQL